MLRLITYLFAVLKLVLLGRWYPPAHVRDVSAGDFTLLTDLVQEDHRLIEQLARQAEAIRKKIYRDEVADKEQDQVKEVLKQPPAPSPDGRAPALAPAGLANLHAGDEVPAGFL